MPIAEGNLQVLTCASCGAPVPIADAARVHCPHCNAEVVIPDTHRQALALAERTIAADRLTQRAFVALGRESVIPLQAFGFIGPGVTLLLFCLLYNLIDAVQQGLFTAVVAVFHVNLWDWLTWIEQGLVLHLALFAVCAAAIVLGALGRRRVVQRAGLTAALAAKPPDRPSGVALCRLCSAPLSIPVNAVGVRCAYCGTDNLVGLSVRWLGQARRQVNAIAKEAREAIRQRRQVTYTLRHELVRNLGIVSLGFAVLISMPWWEGFHDTLEADRDLRLALVEPRLIGHERHQSDQPAIPQPSNVALNGCARPTRIPASQYRCDGNACTIGWRVALRRGEVLRLEPAITGRATLYEHHRNDDLDLSYGGLVGREATEVSHVDVTAQNPEVRFSPARTTAWHRLELKMTLDDPSQGLLICGEITH